MDGVLLSEERCFDASSLAIWEMLYSENYLALNHHLFRPLPEEAQIQTIRKKVFVDNQVLSFIKSYGINANWDIVYLTFSYQLINLLSEYVEPNKTSEVVDILSKRDLNRETLIQLSSYITEGAHPSFDTFVADFKGHVSSKQELFDHLNTLAANKLDLKTKVFSRQNHLWNLGREIYQEWYVGDPFIKESIGKEATQEGKKGFLQDEIPLAPPHELREIFQNVLEQQIDIGIGTGRPDIEAYEPLKALNLIEFFSKNHIVTSSDVLSAEAQFPKYEPLSKPNPFSYLVSYFGKDIALLSILEAKLPLKNGHEILIVGDSIADGLAAQSMGAQFAAVLTGLTGEEARSEFEEMGADYILNNVKDVMPLIQNLVN